MPLLLTTRAALVVWSMPCASDCPAQMVCSLVATDKDMVVGHAMFTHCILDAPQRLVDVQVLSPVGVLPERQRQGIGSMLITTGLEMLNARGVGLRAT